MKKSDYFIALLLTLAIVLSGFQSRDRDNKIKEAIEAINENQTVLQQEIQDIQDSYVSYDDIQPLVDTFDEYQAEVDGIRSKVDGMVFSYWTLDEILKNMGEYAQRMYERNYKK